MNLKLLGIMIAIFSFGILIGGFIVMQNDFTYKDASIMTCNYANNLTDLVNLQSNTLNLYSGLNYTSLNHLNCSKLK